MCGHDYSSGDRVRGQPRAYETTSKVLGPPKTDQSIRDVDMVPAVRHALLTLPSRAAAALVFPRQRHETRMFAYSTMSRAWREMLDATKVRPLRPYDMRHIFASPLITAGKNPSYVSRQMGHHSPAFTLTVYGHLMESLRTMKNHAVRCNRAHT